MPRIFKQLGHGYGPIPTHIVAQIDGTTVFSGTVPTTDVPVPGVEPGVQLGLPCFDWVEPDTYFSGEKTLSITVTNGTWQMGEALAQSDIADPTAYGFVYEEEIGNLIFSDPLTNVVIDGVAQTRPEQAPLLGQWGWTLEAGSSLSATMHVNTLPAHPYIVFDSVPASMVPNSSATLQVSIPQINPKQPLPQTYGWRVVNGTTVDADFTALTGNVEFTTQNSTFSITTTNTAAAGVFRVELLYPSGNTVVTSSNIAIS